MQQISLIDLNAHILGLILVIALCHLSGSSDHFFAIVVGEA